MTPDDLRLLLERHGWESLGTYPPAPPLCPACLPARRAACRHCLAARGAWLDACRRAIRGGSEVSA